MSEWIKMEDRLPPEREPVLCFIHWSDDKNEMEIGIRLGKTFGDYVGGEWFDIVTHWMPLPDPPIS